MQYDLGSKTTFDCGCVWRWWTGEVGPQNRRWEELCEYHHTFYRQPDCTCLNPPDDDGATTCWLHHDCADGSCTHQDND